MRLLRRMVRLLVLGRSNGIRRRVARVVFGGHRSDAAPAPAPAPAPPPAPPPAPEGWTDVASRAEVAERGLIEVRVDDEPVALALVDGALHAVAGTCLHAGGPLADGVLDGTTLVCPYHGWSYDVTTGKCLVDEQLALARYEVAESAGRVRVRRVP
jgi:nitrite reductase/ring-hydroxylating ferredoxin subunit